MLRLRGEESLTRSRYKGLQSRSLIFGRSRPKTSEQLKDDRNDGTPRAAHQDYHKHLRRFPPRCQRGQNSFASPFGKARRNAAKWLMIPGGGPCESVARGERQGRSAIESSCLSSVSSGRNIKIALRARAVVRRRRRRCSRTSRVSSPHFIIEYLRISCLWGCILTRNVAICVRSRRTSNIVKLGANDFRSSSRRVIKRRFLCGTRGLSVSSECQWRFPLDSVYTCTSSLTIAKFRYVETAVPLRSTLLPPGSINDVRARARADAQDSDVFTDSLTVETLAMIMR